MKATVCLLAAVMIFSGGAALAGQKCDPGKPEATPASRFKDNGDGTLTDTKTGLTWRRCALGMEWNGNSCEGQSQEFDFNGAREAIEALNGKRDSGHADWRLPTAEELATIVEPRCYKPAINLELFPYSPETGFWTATEVPGLMTRRNAIIHFINGHEYIANRQQAWRVRPVAGK